MAATIARAIGRSQRSDGMNVETETNRLGHESAEAQANTVRTFATAFMRKDGSGYVQVERDTDGQRTRIGRIDFTGEDLDHSLFSETQVCVTVASDVSAEVVRK